MICGIAHPLIAREITLGISESYIENQNTVNKYINIKMLYIYRCRCGGYIIHLHGGLQYLNNILLILRCYIYRCRCEGYIIHLHIIYC
jgi:hypothetical protein